MSAFRKMLLNFRFLQVSLSLNLQQPFYRINEENIFFIFFYTTLRINQKLLQQHKICFLFSCFVCRCKDNLNIERIAKKNLGHYILKSYFF
jgi:hypothetical protein